MTAGVASQQRWRPAIAIGGAMVALFAGVNVFSRWMEVGASLDRDALEADASVASILDYFGPEFTGDTVLFLFAAIVSVRILMEYPTHRFGWILLVSWGVVPMITPALSGLAVLSVGGVLPVGWVPALGLLASAMTLLLVTLVPLSLALFPTGGFHSRSSGRVFAWFLAIWTAAALASLLNPTDVGPLEQPIAFDNPIGVEALSWVTDGMLELLLLIHLALAAGSLVMRYRAGDGEERLQLKWVVSAVGVLALFSVIASLLDSSVSGYVQSLGGVFVMLAIGIAITKYRLFDIDVVISRALVFGVLAGFITGIYAVVVVGVGSLVGGSSVWWSVGATGLVAVVFEPVRDRVQRWVNRVVYGKRATPYEVLSDLTGRLAATESEEGLLGRMAARLLEGTGADRAVVWLAEDVGFRVAASAPEGGSMTVASLAIVEGVAVPIVHEGEVLGALSVEKRRGEELTPTERRLMEDLAGSAGLVVRRLRLDEALARKADELEESRRRLVDAQDVERRRLERELHDGAQQQVVALKVKLGVAAQMAAEEGTERGVVLIGQMADEAQSAIDQIRSLALGIYPPLLESDGLAVAIPAVAALSPLEVVVDVDVSDRYPRPVEGAIYFCVSEALANAAKHAVGPITVSVTGTDDRLEFVIVDSGPGFDPDVVTRGAGLDNMFDRLDALDGTLTIDSTPGHATTITGTIPTRLMAHA